MIEMDPFRRLILADDTVLEDCECGYSEGSLWCFLKNMSMADTFRLFSDPEKIKTIKFEYGIDNFFTRYTYAGLEEISGIEKRELSIDVKLIGSKVTIEEERIRPERVSDE